MCPLQDDFPPKKASKKPRSVRLVHSSRVSARQTDADAVQRLDMDRTLGMHRPRDRYRSSNGARTGKERVACIKDIYAT